MREKICDRIKTIVEDGPSTVDEIAVELEIDQRHVNANVRDLWRPGLLARRPFYGVGQQRDCVWLYGLPEHLARAA
jgi:predicted transcriptional regulator